MSKIKERVFKLPPRYADQESLTTQEKEMLNYYKSFADENGIRVSYDKELDVALVIFTPNY